MREWLSIPNLFTMVRLSLAPLVMRAIAHGEHGLALGLFAAAAFTDGVDGALARRFNWITRAGAYLDPVADKVLLSGVYLTLAFSGMLPWWLVGIIFGRDVLILVSTGAALFLTKARKFPPSVWGKLCTFLQVITAVAWMARNVMPHTALDATAKALIWPTAAATIWSGLHYGWRGLRAARTH